MKGCVKMGWLRKKFRSIKPHIGHFIYHVFGDRKYWKTSSYREFPFIISQNHLLTLGCNGL